MCRQSQQSLVSVSPAGTSAASVASNSGFPAGVVGGERHAQVGADDVDDGLAVCGVVLGEPFQCVQAAEPDRGLVAAELLDRLGVQLGDAPLGRVTVAQSVAIS